MRSISVRFLLAIGAFALAFSAFVCYRTWQLARNQVNETLDHEGRLALEFNLAVRQYVRETLRPMVEKRGGSKEFFPEGMSSSFVSRCVFSRVGAKLPDYVLKFSAEHPRNPLNQAGPEELEIIRYFREHPEEDRWSGPIRLGDRAYLAHISPMRVESACLDCHGKPEEAPRGLVERYGSSTGFHMQVGDVVALDLVAVPAEKAHAALRREAWVQLAVMGICLAALFGGVFLAFRTLVTRRLARVAEHFRTAAASPDHRPISAVDVGGRDEITDLAASFNLLAARLRDLHASLEEQVAVRTAELEAEIGVRQRAEAGLRTEQQLLRQLLDVYEGHRKLVAYEIHDGAIQTLIGAQMNLEAVRQRLTEASDKELPADFTRGILLLQDGIRQTRQVMSGLRPTMLDELGVIPAIESLVLESREKGLDVQLVCQVEFNRLAPPLETAIFRIVQEALTNVRRHSQSPHARVTLTQDPERVHVEIEDWGVGFDPIRLDGSRFGLNGIRQRAELLGGRALIDSLPGRGTRIVVELPWVPSR